MIVFQAESPDNTASYLVVVIEPENMRRMEHADPITLNPVRMGGLLKPIEHPKRLHLLICYEEQIGEIYQLIAAHDVQGLLKFLMRGYEYLNVDGLVGDLRKKGTA